MMNEVRIALLAVSAALIAAQPVAAETRETEAKNDSAPSPASPVASTATRSAPAPQADSKPMATNGATQNTPMQQNASEGGENEKMRQAAASKSDTSKDRTGNATPHPFVMLVVPIAAAEQNATAPQAQGDCWAKLYDGRSYTGDTFTLVGPVELSNMNGPFGVNWEDVSSLKTGSKAQVTIYDNMNFQDRAVKIRPGQEVPELSDRLGFFEEVESLRISCS